MKDNLLEYFRDGIRLSRIQYDLTSQDTSKTYQGKTKISNNITELLGHNSFRCISHTGDFDKIKLDLNDITAIGGWCAIRTKDLNNIKNNLLENPLTGEHYRFSTVKEVCEWVKITQTLDQITEAVGVYQGNNYTIISERKLWATKLEKTLEKCFGRSLSQKELQSVYDAIVISEERKYIITQRYLDLSTGRKNSIRRIIDEDHLEEMEKNKNILLETHKVYVEDLMKPLMERKKPSSENRQREEAELINYITEYTKVWYFFTGDYLENILKKYGYVDTTRAVLINPWQYAANYEILFEQTLNKIILNGDTRYLKPNTVNENIAFIACISAEDRSFKSYKSHRKASSIPNTLNFKGYQSALREDMIKLNTTFLSDNQFFGDIFNFSQDSNSIRLLNEVVMENLEFSQVKKEIQEKDSQKKTKIVSEIRHQALINNTPKVSELVEDYTKLISIIFSDLP